MLDSSLKFDAVPSRPTSVTLRYRSLTEILEAKHDSSELCFPVTALLYYICIFLFGYNVVI